MTRWRALHHRVGTTLRALRGAALILWVASIATALAPVQPSTAQISDGPTITPADLAQFDAWTNGPAHASASESVRQQLFDRCEACVWWITERMAALVRMYDLTHDERFVFQLRELVEHALKHRDDNHPAGSVLDEFRNRVIPGWGGKSPNNGQLHRASPAVSSLYAHAMAAFARIVVERPQLWGSYGADAVRHANAVMDTVWAFMPEITYRNAGRFVEANLIEPRMYATKPTATQCEDAYQEELRRIENEIPERDRAQARDRARSMRRSCNALRSNANGALAHNINLLFAMVLIELSRALESEFYRNSPDRSSAAEPTRALIPLLVARQQRYFVNRLCAKDRNSSTPTGSPPRPCGCRTESSCRFFWNFSDDVAPGTTLYPEDASHGAIDIRYLELLGRDFARLNAVASVVGEPIPLSPTHRRRFANTFLQKIVKGNHLARNVRGDSMSPVNDYDGTCDGWVTLAAVNPAVYRACRDVTLRIFNGRNSLGIGNHAALLAYKQFAPRPRPPMCPATAPRCCEPLDDGGCARCVRPLQQCP